MRIENVAGYLVAVTSMSSAIIGHYASNALTFFVVVVCLILGFVVSGILSED